MGPYLSQPDTTKVFENGQSTAYAYGACEMQGWRNSQEDAHIADLKLPNGEAVFGVFDGHGGREVSQYVKEVFVNELKENKAYKDKKYDLALTETFVKMDQLMRTPAVIKKLRNYSSDDMNGQQTNIAMATGCTACVAIITDDTIICANSGDSRCVLARDGVAIEMSEDHKPDNVGEKARIQAAGGFVDDGRVKGILSLSRALGDLEYKMNSKLPDEKQMITCVPEIRKETRKANDEFLIIACDGIWDCKTSQEAVKLLQNNIKSRKSNARNSQIIEDMFDQIVARDIHSPDCDGSGTDNMTCIVIEFKK